MNKHSKAIISLLIVILLSAFVYIPKLFAPKSDAVPVSGEAVFHFINVGQGDCIHIF